MAEIVGKIESGPTDTGRAEVAETQTQKDERLRGNLLNDLIKQYRDLVESYTNESGEHTPLDLSESAIKIRKKKVEGLMTQYEDIVKNDPLNREIETFRTGPEEEGYPLNETFVGIMVMLNRIGDRETVFKKAKELKWNNMKR